MEEDTGEIDWVSGMARNTLPPVQPGPITAAFPNDPNVPDLYSEGVAIASGANSISFIFNRLMYDPPQFTPIAVIRVSPEQAKVMSFYLRQAVKDFEEQVGEIPLPPQLREAFKEAGEG